MLESTIEQMAPGQAHYAMKIEQRDLHEWLQDEKNPTAMTMGKLKTASLGITVHYDAERTIISRLLRLARSWRGLKQYENIQAAEFCGRSAATQLPLSGL